MRVLVETELALNEPTVNQGLVTWFHVRVVDRDKPNSLIAQATVARIHVGVAADVDEPLEDTLRADSAELGALYAVFFDEDWFRQQFTEGAGCDLFYLSEVEVEPAWRHRNVAVALVRRLCDTLAQGCELAVLRVASKEAAEPYLSLGFRETEGDGEAHCHPDPTSRWLHLPLAFRQARVVTLQEDGPFSVAPNSTPDH